MIQRHFLSREYVNTQHPMDMQAGMHVSHHRSGESLHIYDVSMEFKFIIINVRKSMQISHISLNYV